ncbi:NAD binding oxidoreductase [Acanthamoeba castellanii str. Neff]|uniref:NAD binding oxidoreductase n=1 Tax=Acanthamoeba castellanii (strain ATCC 30010 / Neff) TaxID=1257118 RepID=L8HHD0_ACACF|nr:NAD binding oxidoreductase [Acanthamoeba castellanii str. Neff]ELR24592.1 NAD binding oxidoreductase [Acanthamoeba castellanii str. Neff]
MVGGGPPGWIGEAHRRAAALAGRLQVSRTFGASLGLESGRVYTSYQEMASQEQRLREEGTEGALDFVVVVTPNPLHYDAGFPVLSDKPLAENFADAAKLLALVERTGLPFGLTHNYSGYPMALYHVKEARELVKAGKLGRLRKVVVTYAQGWLTADGSSITRTSGLSSLVDVGTHAEHLLRYITGLELSELCADITTFVGGVREPDDFNVLLRFKCGAKGTSTGKGNGLKIEVYGSEASLEWAQEEPTLLTVRPRDAPEQLHKAGNPYLSKAAKLHARLPPGHPEASLPSTYRLARLARACCVGYLEGFANVYLNFANTLRKTILKDGWKGIHFVEKVFESGKQGTWVKLDDAVTGRRPPM